MLLPDVPRVGVGPLEDGVLGKVVDHRKPAQPDYFTSHKATLTLIAPCLTKYSNRMLPILLLAPSSTSIISTLLSFLIQNTMYQVCARVLR